MITAQKIISLIDRLNDKLTSYRLMLYFLLALAGWAVLGSFFHQTPYSWHSILASLVWLTAICWSANKLTAKFLDIPANKESAFITALILALILTPPQTWHDLALLAAAGTGAIASKYVITLHNSHIFNPAAAGAFIAGQIFHQYAPWWIGTKFITPIVAIGGLLVLRKMKRFLLAGIFLAVYVLYLIFASSLGRNLHFLWLEVISTPALFFAVVMLIEPLTSPTQPGKYLPYAVLVGLLYSITKLKLSPEEALLIGNLFAFIVAPNRRYALRFIGKSKEADGIFSYGFEPPPKFSFQPGQYMEWTLSGAKTDSRGNRRYLTISSSPIERVLMFTVKQPPQASAFKQRLASLRSGETILASHLAGSFMLPEDPSKKIALLAGGVGITPYRSMVKYLLDKNETRDMVLLYSAGSETEFSFKNLLAQAKRIGLKTQYITEDVIDGQKIKAYVPDWAERTFYVSGPYGYVQTAKQALLSLGVSFSNIITDYFPGYG